MKNSEFIFVGTLILIVVGVTVLVFIFDFMRKRIGGVVVENVTVLDKTFVTCRTYGRMLGASTTYNITFSVNRVPIELNVSLKQYYAIQKNEVGIIKYKKGQLVSFKVT